MSSSPEPCLTVIDGHYYAYRFFHGAAPRLGPDGLANHVIAGFADLVTTLRNDPAVSHWALVFDHSEPSFRHRIFEPYKAQRPPMPDDLRRQLQVIPDCMLAMGIPVLRVPGFEADDVLATLAQQAARELGAARICSRDKDIDQVISPQLSTWDPLRGHLRGPDDVYDERGVRSDQIIDYLMMVGDSADNVPGITGVGPKTAVQLLDQYGDVDTIVAATDHRGKRAEAIAAFKPRCDLVRELITLVTVPDLPPLETLIKTPALPPAAEPILDRLGVLPARHRTRPARTAPTHAAVTLNTVAEFEAWLADLGAQSALIVVAELLAEPLAESTATATDDSPKAPSIAISMSTTDHHKHVLLTEPAVVSCSALRAALSDPLRPLVCDDASLAALAQAQYDMTGLSANPDLAHWLDHSDRPYRSRQSPGASAAERSHVPLQITQARVVSALAQRQQQCRQAAQSWKQQRRQADDAGSATLELQLRELVHQLNHRGCPIQTELIDQQSQQWQAYLQQVLEELRAYGGRNFNPGSPRQCAQLMCEQLGLPASHRTKHGPRIDRKSLQALRFRHPAADLLLQFQLLSSVIGQLLPRLATSGRAHGYADLSYQFTDQQYGLPRCTLPDLDLLLTLPPIGGNALGTLIGRQQHLTRWWIEAPALQAIAAVSNDDDLLAMTIDPQPIDRLAERLFLQAPDTITSEQRVTVETLCSALAAGQNAEQLAQRLGIESPEAKALLVEFDALFPAVAACIDRHAEDAAEYGYVNTTAGRRLRIPADQSAATQRRLITRHVYAGSAADALKALMVAVAKGSRDKAIPAVIVSNQLVVDHHSEIALQFVDDLNSNQLGTFRISQQTL